jgi:hypothetical protein
MIDTKPKPMKASDLNSKFSDSKTQLKDHLAEARTNVNLFIGNHFQKKLSRLSRSLEKAPADSETKIRVTKNHTNTICKFIINSILGLAPTGVILPKNPAEIQDQKSAEIHAAIWEDYKTRNKFRDTVRRWAHDYIVIGEVWVNQFWDDQKGRVLGKELVTDPVTGEPTGENTIREGDVVLERIFSWDVRIDPGAKSFEEAEWVGYEKMVSQDVIKRTFGDSEEIRKACKSDMDETFQVFDSATGGYQDQKGKVLLRQIYFRPCTDYPEGYFVFFTKETILAEGPLPTEIFPIKFLGMDEIPTSPRAASVIRTIRPDQMEVNRCASAIALTQMTLGFDKMIVPAGGQVDSSEMKSGVRLFKVPGGKASADIIPGRAGDQFLTTMTNAISEMYRKTGVPEQFDEKIQDTDILASLYKNQRQKLRFSLYADKFSDFLTDIIMDTLRLKKLYMRDEAFVAAVGKSERINIPEFKSLDDLGFQIKVEPGTEDLETRYGKHLSLTNTMQYLGNNLDKNTIGMLLKQMPFSNSEEIYADYTIEYETARNIMLALDRGEMPDIVTAGSPDYFFKQLEMRKFKPDFKFLPFQVQQAYQQQIDAYKQLYNDNLVQIQRAQEGFIPYDGPTVPVDGMYETITGSNGQPKSTRLQLPLSSLNWLVEHLQAQKIGFGNIQTLPQGQQAELAANNTMGTEMPEGPVNGSY